MQPKISKQMAVGNGRPEKQGKNARTRKEDRRQSIDKGVAHAKGATGHSKMVTEADKKHDGKTQKMRKKNMDAKVKTIIF